MRAAYYLVVIFYICLKFQGIECAENDDKDYTMILQRLTDIPVKNEKLLDFSSLRVSRIGDTSKRIYGFNGNFSINADLDDTMMTEIKIALSVSSNSQFKMTPYMVPKTPTCVFMNGQPYKLYIGPTLTGHSDFPTIPPEGLCPIPKGTYVVDEAPLNYTQFPLHLRPGLYKMDILFYKENQMVGGFSVQMIAQSRSKY